MKHHLILSAITLVACAILGACGSSVNDNPVLGKVPGYYMESSQLRKDLREWAKGQSDPQKILSREAEVKEKQQRLAEQASEAAQELLNTEVPFEYTGANPDFEVINVILEEYNGKGCFTARAYVQAAREMQLVAFPSQVTNPSQVPLVDTYIYYVLLTPDNTGIALGRINPFSDRPALGVSASNVFDFEPGNAIQAGENCTQMGSPIALNCEMQDLTDFAKIKFISADAYRALGGR